MPTSSWKIIGLLLQSRSFDALNQSLGISCHIPMKSPLYKAAKEERQWFSGRRNRFPGFRAFYPFWGWFTHITLHILYDMWHTQYITKMLFEFPMLMLISSLMRSIPVQVPRVAYFLQIMSTTTHPMSTPCMEYLPTLARTKSSSVVGKYTIISPLFPIIWSIWHMGHITIMGMTTTDRRWRLSRWSGTCSPLCWASSAGRISGCWAGPVSSRCGCWYGMVNQGWWCVMWV